MSKKDGQITERLGSILRELREEKGLTREELAERSETGLRHVAAIELGEEKSKRRYALPLDSGHRSFL